MANIVFSTNLIEVASTEIHPVSTATGFAAANVMDFWHLKRRWRMDALTKHNTTPIMYFDLGGAVTVVAVVLDDVNFNKVIIASDSASDGWATPDNATSALTVSCDAQTNRYKIYAPLTGFTAKQYLGIVVPEAASAVGSYTTKWEIGRVGILASVTTFTKNHAYGYVRGAGRAYKDLQIASGHRQRYSIGDMQWEGTLSFGHRTAAEEADLTTLNNLDMEDPLIFYENNSDTSKVYFCVKEDGYRGTVMYRDLLTSTTMRLTELI